MLGIYKHHLLKLDTKIILFKFKHDLGLALDEKKYIFIRKLFKQRYAIIPLQRCELYLATVVTPDRVKGAITQS